LWLYARRGFIAGDLEEVLHRLAVQESRGSVADRANERRRRGHSEEDSRPIDVRSLFGSVRSEEHALAWPEQIGSHRLETRIRAPEDIRSQCSLFPDLPLGLSDNLVRRYNRGPKCRFRF
jgi:hypothetical protein